MRLQEIEMDQHLNRKAMYARDCVCEYGKATGMICYMMFGLSHEEIQDT